MRLATVLLSLLFVLAALEGFIRYVALPGATLGIGGRLWAQRYMQPMNSLGFRGPEPATEKTAARRLVIVGDSFAAGFGLRNYEDAFPSRLQEQLGTDWEVIVLARPGWNLGEYIVALDSHRDLQPDMVMLSLFVNDIESASGNRVDRQFAEVGAPGGVVGFLVHGFALASMAYTHYILPRIASDYWDAIEQCYTDPDIVEEYHRQLGEFANITHELNSELMVVVWPIFASMNADAPAYRIPVEFFRSRNVPVVHLGQELGHLPAESLAINAVDLHPNEVASKMVAGILAEQIASH